MIMTAKQALSQYWNNTAPIDPIAIAKKAGIEVYATRQMEDNLSGVIWRNPENNKIEIIVNGKHSIQRQRFTIAHELGHYFNTEEFEGQIEDSKDILIYNRDNNSSPAEIAANRFAAELLMPDYAIKYMLAKNKAKTIGDLANIFNVSLSAMNVRLSSLGMI